MSLGSVVQNVPHVAFAHNIPEVVPHIPKNSIVIKELSMRASHLKILSGNFIVVIVILAIRLMIMEMDMATHIGVCKKRFLMLSLSMGMSGTGAYNPPTIENPIKGTDSMPAILLAFIHVSHAFTTYKYRCHAV